VLSETGDLRGATAEYREAICLNPRDSHYHYSLGIVLDGQGQYAEAATAYREALRLEPDYAEAHCNLAGVLKKQGKYAESLSSYRAGHILGSKRSDWRYPSANWVRNAERLAASAERLPAVLRGEAKPLDAEDSIGFAQILQGQERYAASARFYHEAFAVNSALMGDLERGRFYAACAAVRAGCGPTRDDPPLDDAARARWRAQALQWLQDHLRVHLERDRAVLGEMLTFWRRERDLSAVRDEAAIARLPEAERAAWRALWAEVDELWARASAEARKPMTSELPAQPFAK
jgi:hypothetical protein